MSNESINESLLETIGRLYGRNQSLQRGHATLTRRVQELEAELKREKARGYLRVNGGTMECYGPNGVLRVKAGPLGKEENTEYVAKYSKMFIDEALISTGSISKADTQLQADIKTLTERVADLEFAASPGFHDFYQVTDGQRARTLSFNRAVEQQIEKSVRPGGVLYGLVK